MSIFIVDMKNEMMKLPANCNMMSEEEMMYVDGCSAIETAVKAVVAVGTAAALTGVAAFAAVKILSIFDPKTWENVGNASKNWWDSITAKS